MDCTNAEELLPGPSCANMTKDLENLLPSFGPNYSSVLPDFDHILEDPSQSGDSVYVKPHSQCSSVDLDLTRNYPCMGIADLFPRTPQQSSALKLFDGPAIESENQSSEFRELSLFSTGTQAGNGNCEDERVDSLVEEDVRETAFSQRPGNSIESNMMGAMTEQPTISQQSDILNRPSMVATAQRETRNHDLDRLIPVSEIPIKFRPVFSKFPFFNIVQSRVFDDVMYTDRSLAISAPTGSGKTVIFELAIVRLLANSCSEPSEKIVYMAPIKALCSERFADWQCKFGPLGVSCCEVTGDSDLDDFRDLQRARLVFTTPEKWDSMTRRWRDYVFLARMVKILLVDEVHLLNDPTRGATIEAVVSRMKMTSHATGLRMIAVSATVPNVDDVAEWLRVTGAPKPAGYKMSEELRPVKLQQIVLGFQCQANCTEFRFDLSLSYKLPRVIEDYSKKKPTLVFCSTRKGAMHTASILVKLMTNLVAPGPRKSRLASVASSVRDSRLRDLLVSGIGYHHAGLDSNDRRLVEEVFGSGNLPILISTGTLAMGVNMPAHLVVIKSTSQYCDGKYCEYSETQLLQMIGRAGRPQFDTTATAVIMTKMSLKTKYESLLGGTQIVESSLHKNLAENLNAEIVLRTITDISLAMDWIRSTFLYIRVFKNPQHYGYPADIDNETVETKLQDLCLRELKSLASIGLINLNDNGVDLSSTAAGRLMANYCVSLDTMRKFADVKGTEALEEILELIASCQEFSDVQLRVTDKKTLNALNVDKTRPTIRFPMKGKIKSREMKINCLIQANFGCLPVQDVSLAQESVRITRTGQRLSRCLSEYLSYREHFPAYSAALTLSQCFQAKLWENSQQVARQLRGIGPALSTALVNAGIVTVEQLRQSQPRQLEMITNRHPPFGNVLLSSIAALPNYKLSIQQSEKPSENSADVLLLVRQVTACANEGKGPAARHVSTILVGDADGKLVFKRKLVFSDVQEWSSKVRIDRAVLADELSVNLICDGYVGLDVRVNFTPSYLTKRREIAKPPSTQTQRQKEDGKQQTQLSPGGSRRDCNHRCADKRACAHECCKNGVVVPVKNRPAPVSGIGQFFNTVAANADTVSLQQSEYWSNNGQTRVDNLSKFRFTRKQNKQEPPPRDLTPNTPNFNLNLVFIDDEDEDDDVASVIVISDDDGEKEKVIEIHSDPDWDCLLDDDGDNALFGEFEPELSPPQTVPLVPQRSCAFRWESAARQQMTAVEDFQPEDVRIGAKAPVNHGDFVAASAVYYALHQPVSRDVNCLLDVSNDAFADNGACDKDGVL